MNELGIDETSAQSFLESHFGHSVGDVEYVGEGAWSRCFGFAEGGRELVVRFGRFVEDFEKDRRAASHRSLQLPVPEMLAMGQAFDGFYAISSRAYGEPLESLTTEAWQHVLPSLFGALDAMRTADLSDTRGYGGWDSQGNAAGASWRESLLAVDDDSPSSRTHGWRQKLIDAPGSDTLFRAGHTRLAELTDEDAAPRHLIHCDLLNRNALVAGGRLSAVFDWGCSVYGDFLYDVALLEFWSPWFPALEAVGLPVRFREHCAASGLEITNLDDRMQACLIHIGLEHVAYHAHTGKREDFQAVTARLEPLLA